MASYAVDYGDDYQYSPEWMQKNYMANTARKPVSNPDLVNAQYNIDLSDEPYYNNPENKALVKNAINDRIKSIEKSAAMESDMFQRLQNPKAFDLWKAGDSINRNGSMLKAIGELGMEDLKNDAVFAKELAKEIAPDVAELGLDFLAPSMTEDERMGRPISASSYASDILELTPAYPIAAAVRSFTEAVDEGKSYEEAKDAAMEEVGIGVGLGAALAGIPYVAKTRRWIPRAKATMGRIKDKVGAVGSKISDRADQIYKRASDTSKWGY